MLLGVAILLIFIGGPDESLSTDGVLYSMKAVVIPRAGFYCIIIAQRMSRVSSRFFLEYHEHVIDSASRDYERKQLLEGFERDVLRSEVWEVSPERGGNFLRQLCVSARRLCPV